MSSQTSFRKSHIIGGHTGASACRRIAGLVRAVGVARTLGAIASVLDDDIIRSFDRKYRVRTSGCIALSDTSFDRSRLRHATRYRPVNGWAFRRLLNRLALPYRLHFADLGSGLGRACMVAGDYGFEKVTGVELAAELCVLARENLRGCRLPPAKLSSIEIVQMDALDYCEQADDDVFFMYKPFGFELQCKVLAVLQQRALRNGKSLIVIYSERLAVPESLIKVFHGSYRKTDEWVALGHVFYVYECGIPFETGVDSVPQEEKSHVPVRDY